MKTTFTTMSVHLLLLTFLLIVFSVIPASVSSQTINDTHCYCSIESRSNCAHQVNAEGDICVYTECTGYRCTKEPSIGVCTLSTSLTLIQNGPINAETGDFPCKLEVHNKVPTEFQFVETPLPEPGIQVQSTAQVNGVEDPQALNEANVNAAIRDGIQSELNQNAGLPQGSQVTVVSVMASNSVGRRRLLQNTVILDVEYVCSSTQACAAVASYLNSPSGIASLNSVLDTVTLGAASVTNITAWVVSDASPTPSPQTTASPSPSPLVSASSPSPSPQETPSPSPPSFINVTSCTPVVWDKNDFDYGYGGYQTSIVFNDPFSNSGLGTPVEIYLERNDDLRLGYEIDYGFEDYPTAEYEGYSAGLSFLNLPTIRYGGKVPCTKFTYYLDCYGKEQAIIKRFVPGTTEFEVLSTHQGSFSIDYWAEIGMSIIYASQGSAKLNSELCFRYVFASHA